MRKGFLVGAMIAAGWVSLAYLGWSLLTYWMDTTPIREQALWIASVSILIAWLAWAVPKMALSILDED